MFIAFNLHAKFRFISIHETDTVGPHAHKNEHKHTYTHTQTHAHDN